MNIRPYIDIHTHREGGCDAISIRSYGIGVDVIPDSCDSLISIGVHPWSAERLYSQSEIDSLERVGVDAIGEIGLDFYRNIDRDRQLEWFEAQLKVAERRDIPVIIHCVKAFEEVLRLLKKHRIRRAIFHSFIGNATQAHRAVERGYYLSISPTTLLSSRSTAAIKEMDREYIFIETDDSDVDIRQVYHAVAQLLGVDIVELRQIVYDNFRRVFANEITMR